MSALRELVAVFGFKVDDEPVKRADEALTGLIETAKKAAVAIGGGFLAKEVFEFARGMAETADRVDDAATALGVSTDEIQAFSYMAASAGDSAGELLNAISMLQLRVQDPKVAGAFSKLGVGIKDASGEIKPAGVLFEEVAAKLSKIQNPAERAKTAVEIFGKAGKKILPALANGENAMEDMLAEVQELGGGISQLTIEQGGQFQKSLAKWGMLTTSFKSKLAEKLLPILTKVVDKVTDFGKWLFDAAKNSNIVQVALGALGVALGVLSVQAAIAFAPFLLAAAAVAAVILLVDDLITLMQGGDSLIGEWIDTVFGKDAHLDTVQAIKDVWGQIVDEFKTLGDVIKPIWEFLKWVKGAGATIGGGIGDAAAQAAAKIDEVTGTGRFANQGKGRGGLSNSQNTAGMNAQRVLEAIVRGDDPSKVALDIPKGEGTRDQYLAGLAPWIKDIQGGKLPQFAPRIYGPVPQGTGTDGVIANTNTFNIQSNDPKAVAAEVTNALDTQHRQAYDALIKTRPTR